MLKGVLVATDFSRAADAALEFAVDVALRHNAELLLLHVCMELPELPALKARRDHQEELGRAEAALGQRVARTAAQGVLVKTLLRTGDPADVIAATARDQRVDLVVVGSHGVHEPSTMLIGSVADRLLRLAPCSVTIVRPTPAGRAAA